MLQVVLALLVGIVGADAATEFRTVSDGIAYARFDGAAGVTGHAFEIALDRAQVRLVPAGARGVRQQVDRIAATYPVHVAVNASFFDEGGNAIGEAVSEGRRVGGRVNRRWGALVVEGQQARIVTGDGTPASGDVVVQGLPRLLVSGAVPSLKPQTAQRTAVCAAAARLVIVIATEPVEAVAFARFLARPRADSGLGCVDALNLDGGSSTQLSVRLPGLTLDEPGAWGVPNALVVVPGATRVGAAGP